MAEGEDLNQVVDEIADRVRRRLEAARAGREEPCSAVTPGARTAGPAEVPPKTDCAPTCTGCAQFDSCNSVAAVKAGAARISPDHIRTSADMAPYIDHTLLKPEATREDVVKVAEEARKYGFATVCVNSGQVATAARVL